VLSLSDQSDTSEHVCSVFDSVHLFNPSPHQTCLYHLPLLLSSLSDSFVVRLTESNLSLGKPAPYLVGLALDEQIVDSVPVEPHDR